ncbi:uncharacterized protein M6B38_252390 [Iris pallida]|uniref:TCP domain-containing protein n=1 Tax=Iris pallida TaxID=29817 RepID=A0AAX6IIC4_IRIPA|nr:uncharacterized protein M6B38_252390 [Iris pallida]
MAKVCGRRASNKWEESAAVAKLEEAKRSKVEEEEEESQFQSFLLHHLQQHHHQQQQQQLQLQQLQQQQQQQPSAMTTTTTVSKKQRTAVPTGKIVPVPGGHIVRSTGRKDRHSKVCTAKGLRDRRVRLSAHTAIEFYDVQDRLGYDRPSMAVDWLMKNAKAAIDELDELPPWLPTADAAAAAAATEGAQEAVLACGAAEAQPVAANSMNSNSDAIAMESFFPMAAAPSSYPARPAVANQQPRPGPPAVARLQPQPVLVRHGLVGSAEHRRDGSWGQRQYRQLVAASAAVGDRPPVLYSEGTPSVQRLAFGSFLDGLDGFRDRPQ